MRGERETDALQRCQANILNSRSLTYKAFSVAALHAQKTTLLCSRLAHRLLSLMDVQWYVTVHDRMNPITNTRQSAFKALNADSDEEIDEEPDNTR